MTTRTPTHGHTDLTVPLNLRASVRTFHIATFGCQMNVADSSTLASSMVARGYRRVETEEEADLLVLNTCSIREKAEQRVYGRLGEIFQLKKENPRVRVAVVGCMAQRLGEELSRRVPHVDYVLGTDRLFELPDVVEGREGTSRVMTAFGHENLDSIAPIKETPYSAFVTISRGCDNYCTYCIVPYVRGKEREHSDDYIVDSVKKLVDEGVCEITLLGQNVNSYTYGKTDFTALLARVARETAVARIRFMTSHPKDMSKRLIDLMADEPKLMRHIHLPLQSGSDRVLSVMGRLYTRKHYLNMVTYIRRKLDRVALTTDLIVGYPTESVEEFHETLEVVREVQYDSAFMFKYSRRPGTIAANMADDVPEPEKIARLDELIRIQQNISYDRNQLEVGTVQDVLVEGKSRKGPCVLRARTEGNKTVLFDAGEEIQEGNLLPIRITAADAFTLHGQREGSILCSS